MRAMLRQKGGARDGRVTFIELFFDLVFVFSIIQLSHLMASHFTVSGVGEALILTRAVWWLWMVTTRVLNWVDPETAPVRVMLVAMMFAALVLSAAIPQAWGDKGLAFAVAFVAMQVGRSLFTAWAFGRSRPAHARNFIRITLWLTASGTLWIAGGLVAHETRLVLWLAALAIEYVGPAAYFWLPVLGRSTTAEWDISGGHLAERCALFVIICLGETILVSGKTFADLEIDATNSAAFAAAFATTCLLWWLYFRFGHENAAHLIEKSDDPGRVGREVFTYAHIPIVLGIILCAVGAEFMLAHPSGHSGWREAAAILGGPATFLAGNLWFKGAVWRRAPLSHMAGLVVLAGLAMLHEGFQPYQLGLAGAGALLLVAVWEYRALSAVRPAH